MAAINTEDNFLSSLSREAQQCNTWSRPFGVMMAVDMGGPVNKAAYVFGTGLSRSNSNQVVSVVMAAVMAAEYGSSVGVFVAALLFLKINSLKKAFNSWFDQKRYGTFISSLKVRSHLFCTLGAQHAIPSFIVGSALTGALVGMARIRSGGTTRRLIFVIAVSNALLYLLFILIWCCGIRHPLPRFHSTDKMGRQNNLSL